MWVTELDDFVVVWISLHACKKKPRWFSLQQTAEYTPKLHSIHHCTDKLLTECHGVTCNSVRYKPRHLFLFGWVFFLNEFPSFLRCFIQVLGCQLSQQNGRLYMGKLLAMSLLYISVTWSAWYPEPQETIGLCCPKWWTCEATENLVLKVEKRHQVLEPWCWSLLDILRWSCWMDIVWLSWVKWIDYQA